MMKYISLVYVFHHSMKAQNNGFNSLNISFFFFFVFFFCFTSTLFIYFAYVHVRSR